MKPITIYARNFRGFKNIELDLSKILFLVGDNSSGKSSILHLVDSVLRSELTTVPKFNEDLGVGEFDFFSPYFNFDDVSLGFKTEKNGKFLAKFITIKRKLGFTPEIRKCTYFTNELAVSLKFVGEKVFIKFIQEPFGPTADFLKIHDINTGFSATQHTAKKSELADPTTLVIASFIQKDEGLRDNVMEMFGTSLPSVSFVGPIRSLPEKYYHHSRKISAMGSHFATMWFDFEERWLKEHKAKIEEFGASSKLFDSINVDKLSTEFEESPFLVSVEKNGRKFLLNQVGVGVSQVVPVLAETLFATIQKSNRIVLFQQPELHLHPVAQAALGTFFFQMASDGFLAILETHSSYLLDRFRAELRDTPIEDYREFRGAQILFCTNDKNGNSIRQISISDDGKLIEAPDDYHDFFVDELLRTMF